MLRKLSLLLAVAVAALGVTVGAVAAPAKQQATTVTVNMTEFKFALSKTSVPKGVVTFKVVNKGAIAHDFKILGKRTPNIAAGKSATLKVTFAKAGKYPYLCTLPSHAPAGMKGVLTVK
jgi:plastocyanin